jgi:hypothetical protein
MTTLDDVKPMPYIDIQKYSGKVSKIENVYVSDLETITFNDKSRDVKYIVIESVFLDKLEILRAVEKITLFQKENIWCYSTSPNSNAMKILDFFNAKNFKELIGKEIHTCIRLKGNKYKTLGFKYD